MQNQSDNKFDGFIHSEIDDLKIDASFDEQWNKMSTALDKKDFMGFSPYSFNIYYLTIILISILVLLGFWFFYKPSNTLKETKKGIITTKTEENKLKDKLIDKSEIQKNNFHTSSSASLIKPTDVSDTIAGEDFKNESTIKPIIDTIQVSSQGIENSTIMKEKSDSLVKAKSVLPKKIKYITKRDTIINIDTTKVRKKR
jgi:hypothetical protein